MKLYLIRHGKTVANERKEYCGVTDSPLSESGIAELKAQKENFDYSIPGGLAVYTSGLTRTEQTLEILFGALPHTKEPAFQEMNFGIFEAKTYEELKDTPEYQTWLAGDNEANVCPGGESGNQQVERVCRKMDSLIEEGKDLLLISHGGTTTALMQHLFPGEGKNRYEWKPDGGKGYLVSINGEERSYEPFPKTR